MTSIRARQVALPAQFWRGGTSKGLLIHRKDLPAAREDWAPLLRGAMGSPDPHGRQLDGMGGGLSSLSKVCVVSPSDREDADVDFTFVQIGIRDETVDYASNCGNMSSAIGPFAYETGLVDVKPDSDRQATVRIFNTNTSKVIHSIFELDPEGHVQYDGDFTIDGVSGSASRITLNFLSPGGSRTGKLFPSGQRIDTFNIDGLGPIEASLIDCANPCHFVRAADLGVEGDISPDAIQAHPVLLQRLESIRQYATVKMGMATTTAEAAAILSVPKICMLSPAKEGDDADLVIRCISSGDPHRAVPMTVALNIAAAARMKGTIVQECLGGRTAVDPLGTTIAHPSGKILVSAEVEERDGEYEVKAGTVYRTARNLFQGTVYAKVR